MAEQARILPDLNAIMARLAKLEAENASLKSGKGPKVRVAKSADGMKVSVYGIGRFPATFYKGQWEGILANAEAIKALVETLPEKAE